MGLIILILSPIAYLGLNKIGYRKTGIVIAILMALIVMVPAFLMIFESELYWKSDVRKDIDNIGIVLTDDFEILENDIVGSVDYYQTTELLNSPKDRDRIIEKIESSDNYKLMDVKETLSGQVNRKANIKEVWNYKFDNSFVQESYKKKEGYTAVEIVITLRQEFDTLGLSVIMD